MKYHGVTGGYLTQPVYSEIRTFMGKASITIHMGYLSSIDIPSRHHPINYDYLCPIINLKKDSVVPHTNPVTISGG